MKEKYINKNVVFDSCTGCGACYSICPVQAITMQEDQEGFLYPVINPDKCVNCHRCEKVCPVLLPPDQPGVPNALFSGYIMDEKYQKQCSSGGVFGRLADKIISNGGIVFGAVFNSGNKKVIHSSNLEYGMDKICRSKYVQSEAFHCYSDIKHLLTETNRKVLFCGCPCQVAGLKQFLGESYENLITIDFVCHGVPSPGVFRDFLAEEEKLEGKKVLDITFREKNAQGKGEEYLYLYLHQKKKEFRSLDHFYYYLFLHNCILRRSCMNCEYPVHHYSDLTLADDWEQNWVDDPLTGVSLIQTNTDIGSQCMREIFDEMEIRQIEMGSRAYIRMPHDYDYKDRNNAFKSYRKDKSLDGLKRFFKQVKFRNEMRKRIIHDLSVMRKRLLKIIAFKKVKTTYQ